MLFNKFWKVINRIVPDFTLSEDEAQALSRLDPKKIYIENVRSILGVSHGSAKRICETAVRQGIFERRVEVLCPDGVVAASADIEANLPVTVLCWVGIDDHPEEIELPTANLQKTTFYRLNESQSDSVPHGRTA